MTAKVYGIPNCSSVKKALLSLQENDIEALFHDFKKHGVSPDLLDEWMARHPTSLLINRKGTTWRNLEDGLKEKAGSPEGAKALMLEYPCVIKRPVVDYNGQLTVGQTDFSPPHEPPKAP